MYFLRLTQLKETIKEKAEARWHGFTLGGQEAHFVERVLDVRQGELCWVVGTVYMVMPKKPNVMDDILKDVPLLPDQACCPLLTSHSTG
jgi:DNA polymerase delta subunit 2